MKNRALFCAVALLPALFVSTLASSQEEQMLKVATLATYLNFFVLLKTVVSTRWSCSRSYIKTEFIFINETYERNIFYYKALILK